MPEFLPDVPEVREDVADYLGECEAVDAYVGVLMQCLKQSGDLDRTIIVISGDHGMPGVPSGKCSLYDHGVSVALIVKGPGIKGRRIIDDVVRLLTCAHLHGDRRRQTTRQSIRQVIAPGRESTKSPRKSTPKYAPSPGANATSPPRARATCRTPMRGLRTQDYLYIRNFTPDRWPIGSRSRHETSEPPQDVLEHQTKIAFADMDGSPAKAWLVKHRHEEKGKWYYDLAFGRRPLEELYDLHKDPDMVHNLAADPAWQKTRQELYFSTDGASLGPAAPRAFRAIRSFDNPPEHDVPLFGVAVALEIQAVTSRGAQQGELRSELSSAGCILR